MVIKRFFFGVFTLLLLCTSCQYSGDGTKEYLIESKILLENAEDADVAFREIIRNNRIIFLGEDNHIFYNMDVFLIENIQVIYDEGIRYIFSEGGEPLDDTSIPLAGTFYPWLYTGGGYDNNFNDEVEKFNQTKAKEDQIKMIALEKGRTSFPPGEMTMQDLYDYRSSHMAELMLREMENIDSNDKILVLAGDLHGATELYTGFIGGEMVTEWKTLGVYLKEAYGDDYFAIQFFMLSPMFEKTVEQYPEWYDIPTTPKFLITEMWMKDLYVPIKNQQFLMGT